MLNQRKKRKDKLRDDQVKQRRKQRKLRVLNYWNACYVLPLVYIQYSVKFSVGEIFCLIYMSTALVGELSSHEFLVAS